MEIEGNEIKNNLLEILQRKIDEINKIYNNFIENNNKIILIIEQLIKSYQLFKDTSTIQNLLNNSNFNEQKKGNSILNTENLNLDIFLKRAENYFNNEFIISNSSISIGLNKQYFISYYSKTIKCFVEIDDNLCASCFNNQPNIRIFNIKNFLIKEISFKAYLKHTDWIIKSNKNNLISYGDDRLIKIWPVITEHFLSDGKSTNIQNENTNNLEFNDIRKKINIDLNPLYIYKVEDEEMKNIEKMIGLKENQFLIASKNNISLFKYTINENDIKIELIKNNNIFGLVDIISMEKDNNEIIAMNTNNILYFLNIPNLEIINKISFKCMCSNSLIKLNLNELLVIDSAFIFKIVDIKTFKVKFAIKNYISSDFLLNLKDGTLLQASYYGIKRFLIKTMEELPDLIRFRNDYNDDYYNYDYYSDKVIYMYKLRDGSIILCYQNGLIEICNLKFI